jgi:hypothetical protein
MSPSRRAMNPSTLMPRNTDPVKEESMGDTVPQRYDDVDPVDHRLRVRPAGASRRSGAVACMQTMINCTSPEPSRR